ncbi:MAG TPA: glycosyltransferase [Candidatus Polarisedimenticolia bacterium]|nr:glycosyltransferase [Candidatus Polarisedimenticolia bacterium]
MKVLLSRAFNPAFEALPEYLASALRSLGHDVALFDHRRFLVPGRLRRRVALLERLDRARLNRAFLAAARRHGAALVIVNQGMNLEPAGILRLRDAGVRVVNWFSDFPAEFDLGMRTAPAYDAFHLGSSWAVERHRAAGHRHAAWLPFACDPETHHPAGPPPQRCDQGRRIVFTGSHYPERQVLLRHLRGLPVDVYGPGWEAARHDDHLVPMLRGGALRPEAWRRLYSEAAAVLNIHYGALGPASVSGEMANTRAFEIPACGALQIADRRRDLQALFREGEHWLGFSSGEELRAVIETALTDESLARRIAAAGRRAVLNGHTYADRARVLLGEAEAFALPVPTAWSSPVESFRGSRRVA